MLQKTRLSIEKHDDGTVSVSGSISEELVRTLFDRYHAQQKKLEETYAQYEKFDPSIMDISFTI